MSERARCVESVVRLDVGRIAYPCWLFSFGSVAGWLLELAFRSVSGGALCIPGFSFGPYCPIYGLGFLMIAYLCAHQNKFVAFGKMVALSSLLEYVLSALSENLFHELLWDYSNLPFSIGTRVNLIFSLAWGALGMFVLTVVEPRMRRTFARHSAAIRRFSVVMSALIVADLCISALSRMM